MARTVTLGELVTALEQRADIENDQHFSHAEKVGLINEGLTDLYDELVTAAPPDYYLKDYAWTTIDSQASYTLPADFFKIRRVQVVEQAQRKRSLLQMQPDERIIMVAPLGGCQMALEYIPACAKLVDDADEFDGVNGWQELVVLWATDKVYRKKRLPIGELASEYQAILGRIRANAYQDPGSPPMIQRASLRNPMWPWTSTAQPVTHYRLRGLGSTRTLEIWRKDLVTMVTA